MGQAESSPEELSRTKGSKESRSSITKMITSGEKIDWSDYDQVDDSFVFDIDSDDGKKRLMKLKTHSQQCRAFLTCRARVLTQN